jgi:hypothetical protein
MKTAVEWLVEQMTQGDFIALPKPEWIKQAKEMEKSENKYFYDHGFYTGRCTHNDKDESFEYFFNCYKSE